MNPVTFRREKYRISISFVNENLNAQVKFVLTAYSATSLTSPLRLLLFFAGGRLVLEV
jgi:hypothetical protein